VLRSTEMHPDVCAVMVTYNPGPSLEQNIRAILPQIGKIFLVDNQSYPTSHAFIAQTAADLGVEVIWSAQNLGIAGGLNEGIDRALSDSTYAWVALFDQDSLVPEGFVSALLDAYAACPLKGEVAVVGASYSHPVYESRGRWTPEENKFEFRELKTVMTSGSLVKVSALPAAGKFNEDLFMDYVDHDFCLRLRKHGFRVIQAGSAVLAHQLGDPTLHRFLGKHFLSSNHSASRRYHNARNRVLVYRRYLWSETAWVAGDLFGWVREMAKVALVEHDRRQKFRSAARGIWDAVRGGKGKTTLVAPHSSRNS
jgi:rhamnosyltransferase